MINKGFIFIEPQLMPKYIFTDDFKLTTSDISNQYFSQWSFSITEVLKIS